MLLYYSVHEDLGWLQKARPFLACIKKPMMNDWRSYVDLQV